MVGKSDFNENPIVSLDFDFDFGLRLRVCQKKEENKYKVKYIGESARSLYKRSREHMDDYNSFSEKFHMLKHCRIS